MANENTFRVAVELDYLERQLVAYSNRALVLFLEVAGRAECLYAFLERDNGSLVGQLNYLTIYDSVNAELSLQLLPRILLELLVTKAQTAVSYVDVKYNNLDLSTDLGELIRVFDLLGPAQVADVDQTVNAFLDLYEDTEALRLPTDQP